MIFYFVLQAIIVSSPEAQQSLDRNRSRVRAMESTTPSSFHVEDTGLSAPLSTKQKPVILPDAAMAGPDERMLSQSKNSASTMSGSAFLKPVPVAGMYPACRSIGGHPAGQTRNLDKKLNGYVTIARCGSFTVAVSDFDYRYPVTPMVIETIPGDRVVGTVNGGSYARAYMRSRSGKGAVELAWLGRERGVTVEVSGPYSRVDQMERLALDMVGRITAGGER